MERIVLPIGREFAPDLVFISAGQDASVHDPLARMSLTTGDCRDMTRMMMALADDACGGRASSQPAARALGLDAAKAIDDALAVRRRSWST